MKRNKLFKNTIILILGGLLTKILGFLVKIIYTRYLKEEGLSLITLIFPTYNLLLTISSFALPFAVSKLIAKENNRKSKIMFNALYITLIFDFLLIGLIYFLPSNIYINILHNEKCIFLIKILVLNLPFVSITSIIKAYFFGTENVLPITFSNVIEELIKIILIISILPNMLKNGILYGVTFFLLINIACEIASFFVLYIFLPKKIQIKKLSYKINTKCISDLFKISVPTASGRIVGAIGYFFEPIILTNLLIYKNYSSTFIHLNYGYFQGYAIAILTIPSFFLVALSSNIVPSITKLKNHSDEKHIKKIINKVLSLVLLLSLAYCFLIEVFGKNLMKLLYKSTKGFIYLKTLCPFFILFYLEGPLLSFLQSLDKEKTVFKITTSGIIIKNISLVVLILLNFGFNSLIICEIINIIYVVSLSIYHLRKSFDHFSQSNKSSFQYKRRKILL